MAARLAEAELAEVRERAAKLEISASELLRRAVLRRPLARSKIPAANMRAIGELGRIGNNLNQLVKLAHMGRVSTELGIVAAELRDEIECLREELAGARPAAQSRDRGARDEE